MAKAGLLWSPPSSMVAQQDKLSFSSSFYSAFPSSPVCPRRRVVLRVACMAADYYSTLGVPKSASKKDIKTAYRRLARQYHPDVNKEANAEDKFKEISNAYEVLLDDSKRSLYDDYGEAGLKGASSSNGFGTYAANPFDLFESIFGSSGGFGTMGGMGSSFGTSQCNAVEGDDLRFDMSLKFNEAIFGTEKEFEISHLEKCASCNGTGARSSANQKTCRSCGGRGQVMKTRETAFGLFSQVSICSTCGGEGQVITNYCKKCGGEGCVRVKKKIELKIPAGVNSDSTLRVRGEGDAGPRGGPAGDLYVFLNVKGMPGVQRDGVNLYSNITVNYTDAILGTVVKVKTVEGLLDLRIPAGTQLGDVLVLSKKGVPKLNKPSVRGDHLFTVKITIPTRLSDVERGLVKELAALSKTKGSRGGLPKIHPIGSQRVKNGKNDKFTKESDNRTALTTQKEKTGEGIWSAIKDFAGFTVDGISRWLRDNA